MTRKKPNKDLEKTITEERKTQYPAWLPEWYWTGGLHDAKITSAAEINGRFIIELDCEGAMFDHVEKMTFWNHKVLESPESMAGMWWLDDELKQEQDKYILRIHMAEPMSSYERDRYFEIRFRDAEIIYQEGWR